MADLPPITRPPRPQRDGTIDQFELNKWFDLVWRHLGGTTTSSSNPPATVVPPVVVVATEIAYPDIIIPARVIPTSSASYTAITDVDTTITAACIQFPTTINLPTTVGYVAELCIKHTGFSNFILVAAFTGQLIESAASFIVYPGESINIRVVDNQWWVV